MKNNEPRETTAIETYTLQTRDGRPIRKATRVTIGGRGCVVHGTHTGIPGDSAGGTGIGEARCGRAKVGLPAGRGRVTMVKITKDGTKVRGDVHIPATAESNKRVQEGVVADLIASGEVEFAVLLYPPTGVPRVIELRTMSDDVRQVVAPNMASFPTKADAEAALEKFLTDNPEYRNWRDGRIQS